VESLPDRGSLESQPFPALLLALLRRRFTGRLDVAREGARKRIWLRDGIPVLAESNLPSESLGIQLLDAGRITRDEYLRVVERVRERACREGAALVSLGLVTPQDLFAALREQVRRRLLDCAGWPRGEFAIDPDDPPPPDASAFRCDPISLAQEAVAVHWSPARVCAALGGKRARYPVPRKRMAALAARLHVDPEVEQLLGRLGASPALGALLDATRAPSALAALWVLDAAGAIDWRDAPPASLRAPGADGALEFEIVTQAPAGPPAPPRPGAPGSEPEPPRGAAEPMPAPSEAAASARAEALRAEILARHRDLATRDHYAALGLAPDADADAIRRAYLAAAKRFHPDALARAGLASLRTQAQEIFARLAQAHETLSDPARRRAYDSERQAGGEVADAAQVVQAEALYRKGEVLLRAGNFAGAVEFLGPAVALWPEEAAYQSALGWALYKRTPSDPGAARRHLERAVALAPDEPVAHFRLGLVLRALGEAGEAERELGLAQRLDPKLR
jgi:tetratricopeptide (TPR) repeat protein